MKMSKAVLFMEAPTRAEISNEVYKGLGVPTNARTRRAGLLMIKEKRMP
jgi:hypothetical protein